MPDKDKKAFALRISSALLKEIEQWAGDEFRSTNGQIEYIISQAIKARKRKSSKKDTDTNS